MARAGVVLVLAVLALIAVVHGGGAATTARTGPARILVAMPWNNYSHMQVVYPVVRALCARGHEVVLLSRVPMPPPLPANFKFVQLDFNSPAQQYGFEIGRLQQISAPFRDAYNILALGLDHCQLLLGQEPVQRLLQGGPGGAPAERFDLVITELFFTDCYVALAHRLGAPHLFVNSGPLMPWGYARFGVPSNPAHVAAFSLPVTDDMPFAARLQNAALWAANAALYHLWFAPREQAVVDALVPAGTPPLARLLPDAAMLLLNTHPALSPARPLPPNVVEVGGLHIAPEQALPQDLEQFVSGAKDGVILFSLGSMIRASSLPKENAAALLRGFGTLKQRVVWKWEDEAPGPVPKNVRLSKWLPQFDVLCHNNTRLFIGHGGLLSTSEAAHCGVPLLGIAMYGDQRTNLAAVAKAGAGRSLPYSTLKNADLFLKNVKDLLEDPSFQQSATALSERFRDRPMSPLDTAVYWTEYVIRHKGAPHLRGAARNLTWYQEALLDVFAVVFLCLAAALYVAWTVVRTLLRLVMRVGCSLTGACDQKAAPKKKKQ